MHELLKSCSFSQFKETGVKKKLIDDALAAIDNIKQLFMQKKEGCNGLILKFISGPNKGKTLKIDGSRMLFGSGAKSQVRSVIESNFQLSSFKYC